MKVVEMFGSANATYRTWIRLVVARFECVQLETKQNLTAWTLPQAQLSLRVKTQPGFETGLWDALGSSLWFRVTKVFETRTNKLRKEWKCSEPRSGAGSGSQ